MEARIIVPRQQRDGQSEGSYAPSMELASPRDFIDSSCLPALCCFSPSARNSLILASLSAGRFLAEGACSLASISFITLGQLWASAQGVASMSRTANAYFFMTFSFE